MELSKAKIELYASLSSKKMRQKHGLFLVEGEKCVRDTLGRFPLECLIMAKELLEQDIDLANDYPDKLRLVSNSVIGKISSLSTPPRLIAVFQLPEEDNDIPSIDAKKLYLVLDGIQDPGNLGTIIRTADWFGIDTIFASLNTVDVYNPKVVQATMGSLKRVKVIYADLTKIIRKELNMPVYGMLLDGRNLYSSRDIKGGGFIIMGNEGNGISPDIRALITRPLLIPPYYPTQHPESLNVAIATAVTLSWFRGNSSK